MSEKSFLVEVSARHVHLDRAAMDILFGQGSELTVKKELSQPGQFAAEQKVELVGPKRSIANVSVLGPLRGACQVEVSLTDAVSLGIVAPVRESGDIKGTPGVKLVGPCGELVLECGIIAAKRHIHMTTADAAQYGVANGEIVSVAIDTDRPLVFGDVVVRVSDKFGLAMHVDTDEGNAGAIPRAGTQGRIVK